MNMFNIYNEALEIHCRHIRRLYDYGQSWCTENHDMLHCDETCPFRDEEIVDSYISTTSCPHNIYE